jgi:hypothetical protein
MTTRDERASLNKNAIGRPRIDLSNTAALMTADKEILQPGDLGATIELVVRDGIFNPEGKVINHIGPKRSESFTQQFFDFLWCMFAGVFEINPIAIRNTGNVLVNMGWTGKSLNANAAVGSVLSGIVVGTGNTAPVISNYVMETLILHDAAPPTAGRMQYSIVSFGAPAADATTSQFTITRNFANASGGAITVNEVGLYVSALRGDLTTGIQYFLTIRDVIAGGILVANGQTLTVNYRPQAVV